MTKGLPTNIASWPRIGDGTHFPGANLPPYLGSFRARFVAPTSYSTFVHLAHSRMNENGANFLPPDYPFCHCLQGPRMYLDLDRTV